jgi:hypothetical protein
MSGRVANVAVQTLSRVLRADVVVMFFAKSAHSFSGCITQSLARVRSKQNSTMGGQAGGRLITKLSAANFFRFTTCIIHRQHTAQNINTQNTMLGMSASAVEASRTHAVLVYRAYKDRVSARYLF